MKRFLSAVLSLMMVSAGVSCMAWAGETELVQGEGDVQISYGEFRCYIGELDQYLEMPLYFVDGVEDLPYVDLADWADVMVTLYDSYVEDPDYYLTLETDGPVALCTRENGYSMLVDFEKGTIDFDDYDSFIHNSGDSSLLDLVTTGTFDQEEDELLMKRIEKGSFDRYGRGVEIELANYGITLVWSEEEDLYLIPLQTMGDLLLSMPVMLSTYFNGEAVYLAGPYDFIIDEELTPLGESYFAQDYCDMSRELADYNYGELCMALDHFYGLKETHAITDFDAVFDETGYKQDLSDTDPNIVDGALEDFIHYYLDDLHSGFLFPSWRTEEALSFGGGGISSLQTDSTDRAFGEARDRAEEEILSYEEVGNTAYITFDSFDFFYNPSAYYEAGAEEPDPDPASPDLDTIQLILYAHEQICRKNSPIENVVLDLSMNGGGAIDAGAFVTAWFLGDAQVSIKSTLTGALSTVLYRADMNLDGAYDESDTVEDKKLFCLISPVSFSCGNLVPSVFKASHKVTLLGQTSGGGSCLVLPMSTACGAGIQISSPHRLSYVKNGSYYDIDTGVEPDCYIANPDHFYDRQLLTDYINQLF